MECEQSDQQCIFGHIVFNIVDRPYWVRIIFSTVMFSIFLVGIFGNLVTCVVIYCDKTMHTATNYYLFNLAVSDLIAALGIPLELNVFLDHNMEYDKYGDTICQAQFFLIIALWNNSIMVMTALAIERYIAIWHPLLLNKRPVWRRVGKIIVVIWLVAIFEAFPEIWTVRFVRAGSFGLCFVVPTTFARILNAILGFVNFLIPFGIMLFVYTMVALKVNVTHKSSSEVKIFNIRDNSSKINRLITLTLAFLLCWMPFFLVRVFVIAAGFDRLSNFVQYWDHLIMVCSCNSWSSIVLNPLLFSLMSTKFRKALKNLWNTKVRKIIRSRGLEVA